MAVGIAMNKRVKALSPSLWGEYGVHQIKDNDCLTPPHKSHRISHHSKIVNIHHQFVDVILLPK
jgi:ribosomal protein L32E